MGVLYETKLIHFVVLTCLLGGGAAWMAGRAVASTWRPILQLLPYMLLLGAAIRFLHYALLGGTLLSAHYYLVDCAILVAVAVLAFRVKRAEQMVTQYRWLYERTGPIGWRERQGSTQTGV